MGTREGDVEIVCAVERPFKPHTCIQGSTHPPSQSAIQPASQPASQQPLAVASSCPAGLAHTQVDSTASVVPAFALKRIFLTPSPTHPPHHSLSHSLSQSLTHSPTHSFSQSHAHLLTLPLTHSLTHPRTHSLSQSPAPPPTSCSTAEIKKTRSKATGCREGGGGAGEPAQAV